MGATDRILSGTGGALVAVFGALSGVTGLHAAAPVQVDFARDIRPILEVSCLRCHGPVRPRGGFRLDNREAALRGGDYGAVLVPGRSDESPLLAYVAHEVPGLEMPPLGQGDPLTTDQIDLLRAWIDQGLDWPESPVPPRRLRLNSSVQWVGVEGNRSLFRAHTFQKDGWSGGLSEFDYEEWVDPGTSLRVRGRSWFNQEDYGLSLELRRRELGFARVEVETWRKYYDDHGWFYAPYGSAPSLDRELETRHGRAGLTVGWTPPRWPQFTVGYEYQWKEGDQASLAWGVVSPDPMTDPGKAIRPGWLAFEEAVHRWTLAIEHTWETGLVADNLFLELYDRRSRGTYPGNRAADLLGRYSEDYDHRQVVNVLRTENQFNDWLFLSGGYLFSQLEGDGSLSHSLESMTGAFPPFPGDAAPDLVVRRRSHTFNANALAGAWQGFRLSGGLQAEWLDQDGLGQWIAPIFPNPAPGRNASGQDRLTLDQTVGLQYDRLPHTVVHAEGRWQQQWTDHRQSAFLDDGVSDSRDFERQSDARGRRQRYGIGATLSPWTRASLDAGYRWESRATTYDHRVDRDGSIDPALSGNGYPAFIRSRVIEGDEVEVRVAWRVRNGLRVTLKYGHAWRDYRSNTDSSLVPFFPDPVFYPGGHILSGRETAHSGGAGLSLIPWRRLHLNTSLTYTDSRLVTGNDDGAVLAPYDGWAASVLSSASWVATRSTDLQVTHAFARAEYQPQSLSEGLPLGMSYQRHAVSPAVIHRLSKHTTVTLRYGFFEYTEPTFGGARDYTAHLVMAGLTWQWN
jgi:hypothetical protein